jgi:hypothetical protein
LRKFRDFEEKIQKKINSAMPQTKEINTIWLRKIKSRVRNQRKKFSFSYHIYYFICNNETVSKTLFCASFYRKTPLLVPGAGPFSNAGRFELDQLMAEF